jgi:hypothetical protein
MEVVLLAATASGFYQKLFEVLVVEPRFKTTPISP